MISTLLMLFSLKAFLDNSAYSGSNSKPVTSPFGPTASAQTRAEKPTYTPISRTTFQLLVSFVLINSIDPGSSSWCKPTTLLTSLCTSRLCKKGIILRLKDRAHIIRIFTISRDVCMIVANILWQRRRVLFGVGGNLLAQLRRTIKRNLVVLHFESLSVEYIKSSGLIDNGNN
jgi:hypothetical protein